MSIEISYRVTNAMSQFKKGVPLENISKTLTDEENQQLGRLIDQFLKDNGAKSIAKFSPYSSMR